MRVFQADDYTDVIKQFLKEHSGQIGIKTEFANACGCKLSYLSQVLSGSALFTLDHAHGAATFMRLSEDATDYFILLVQLARAGNKEYRHYLEERIQLLRKKSFKVAAEINASNGLSQADLQIYCSNHLYQAIHILLTIPSMQNFESLRAHLSLSSKELRALLIDLRDMGLVKAKGESWMPVSKDMHVPADSPLAIQRHLQWKLQAVRDMQLRTPESVHYSATFSLSTKDFEKLKGMLIDFVKSSRDLALKSREDEAAHVDLSLFKI